jgi:hypothetical protein
MGTSTDGILFYGFPIEEDGANANVLAGLTPEGEEIEPEVDDYDPSDEDSVWAEKFGLKEEAVWEHREKYPVEIVHHCSSEYPMYGIAVRESHLSTRRGHPKEVKSFEVQPNWDSRLRGFCKVYGLVPPEKFGWYLASYWG